MKLFTDAQRQVIETWGQGVAVLAGAGSGKTTTLVEKCRVLIERKPDARFAAVSFTEKSAQDIEKKLGLAACLETSAGLQSVGTIHGFCGSLIREFEQEAGLEGGERVLSDLESTLVWESAVRELWAEGLPNDVRTSLEQLWERESRRDLEKLLGRVRDVEAFGALRHWEQLARGEEDARALKNCAEFVIARYARLKQRQGVLDFSDLEKRALQCLESPSVQRVLWDRFDLVLGDEFQDTNPVQAEILSRIVRPDRSNVVVVGDPKQSIYRFRDADVSLFQSFCESLPVRVELLANFRSEAPVLEWINAACAPAFAESGLEYQSLIAGRDASGAANFVGVRKLLANEDGEVAARQLAAFLRDRSERDGVSLSEYVVLLRSVRGGSGARFLQGLARAGLPVLILSGADFWGDPRVAELIALLEWYWSDTSTQAAVTCLRAPWVRLPDLVIDQVLVSGLTSGTTESYWNAWGRTVEFEASVLSGVGQLRSRRGVAVRPGEVLECLLHSELGGSLLIAEMSGIALNLWHKVEDWSESGLGFGEILEQLRRARDEGRREKELPPPEGAQGAVRVMTVHSSKGLEFPRVILVDLGKKRPTAKAPLFFWDRDAGAFLGRKEPDGTRIGEDDPEELVWRERENRLEAAENRRVFYVALTRAEKEVLLLCPDVEEGKKLEPWREWVNAAPAEIVRLPDAEVGEASPEPAAESRPHVSGSAHNPRWRRARHSVTEWNWLERCDRAYVAKVHGSGSSEALAISELDFLAEKRHESRGLGGQSEDLGTQVHTALEKLHGANPDIARARLSEIEKTWGAGRFRADLLWDWWARDQTRLRQSDARVLNEFAFDLTVGSSQEILVGAMDRVEQCGPVVRVLDYKVVGKSKSVAEWVQLYGMQMRLYAAALRQLTGASVVETSILAISPESVEEVVIPLESGEALDRNLAHTAARAEEWIRSPRPLAEVTARPSAACRFCPAVQQCSDGRGLFL